MVPLVICFIRHKVDRIPGAYTTYAFFEWSLIFWDVGFDAVSAIDLEFITFTAFTPKSRYFVHCPCCIILIPCCSSSSSQTPSTFVSPLVVLGAMATNLPIANTRKALVDVYLGKYVSKWMCHAHYDDHVHPSSHHVHVSPPQPMSFGLCSP